MPSDHPQLPPKRFFGLDPSKLLAVLDAGDESAPQIPGWEITGIAGRGGFGTVWRAEREADGVAAAIKIAPASDPETLERIEGEIGALRALNHPHIVSLLDSGALDDAEGGLFLAMEFIDGVELCHEIPPGGMPVDRAYQWFREISDAVAHAHEAGILHRDLKPANILLDHDGHAKVADFGLALPVHRRVQQLSLTRAGMVAGTAEYLPPEAYRPGYEPSPATDVFALGVILHEMLAGNPPRGSWPPVSESKRVDVRMDGVIRRALDPDPRRRWQGVREMRAAFDEIINSPPRYAGTPLITFPVRCADFFWTIIGLLMGLASGSSLLHLRGASFDLPLDLIGDHSTQIGGYHAVFVLLQPAVFLGVWQVVRLWRFRNVPMREALPSPFGLRLGHGVLAAVLVGMCQFFCLWAPALQIATIFFDTCISWLRPDDPPWRTGLAVVAWKDGSLVSPWAWHTPGEGFWLFEGYGPPGHPLWRQVDRIGFTPVLFPLMMSMGGLALVAALLSVLLVAARTWWRRDHRVAPLVIWVLAAGTASLFAEQAGHWLRPRPPELLRQQDGQWINGQMCNHMAVLGGFLLGEREEPILRGGISHWSEYYADPTDYRGHGMVPQREIGQRWQDGRTRAAAVEVTVLSEAMHWDVRTEAFLVRLRAVEAADDVAGSGASQAVECVLELSGIITLDGRTVVEREVLQRTTLYEIAGSAITLAEATAWAESLREAARQAAVNDPAAAARLAELFLPLPIGPDRKIGGWLREVPAPESGMMAQIRNELRFESPADVKLHGTRPGGRAVVRVRLVHSPAERPRWLSAELIRHADTVKCVRLTM